MVYMQTPYMYHQYGNGLPSFRGGVMQKGYGLGGLFKGLMRAVAPKLKQGLIKVGKRTLKTGIETLTDVASGENLKTSLKRRANQNIQEMVRSSIPIKRKNNSKPFIQQTKLKRARRLKNSNSKKKDIFS